MAAYYGQSPGEFDEWSYERVSIELEYFRVLCDRGAHPLPVGTFQSYWDAYFDYLTKKEKARRR